MGTCAGAKQQPQEQNKHFSNQPITNQAHFQTSFNQIKTIPEVTQPLVSDVGTNFKYQTPQIYQSSTKEIKDKISSVIYEEQNHIKKEVKHNIDQNSHKIIEKQAELQQKSKDNINQLMDSRFSEQMVPDEFNADFKHANTNINFSVVIA